MTKPMSARRAGRTLAFQVLYGFGFVPPEGKVGPKLLFARDLALLEDQTPDSEAEGFARDLVVGVHEKCGEIDGVIREYSKHWKFERIAKVELAILRLALFELMHRPDIPLKVAINEAIELSKTFGDENSRNFVNGILDAVAKAIDHGQFGVGKKF